MTGPVDEELDLALELVVKLTEFYQEAMEEAGLDEKQRMLVTLIVARKQMDDINS